MAAVPKERTNRILEQTWVPGERRAGGLGEEEGRRLLKCSLSAFCPSVLEQNLGSTSRADLCYCHVAPALCSVFSVDICQWTGLGKITLWNLVGLSFRPP